MRQRVDRFIDAFGIEDGMVHFDDGTSVPEASFTRVGALDFMTSEDTASFVNTFPQDAPTVVSRPTPSTVQSLVYPGVQGPAGAIPFRSAPIPSEVLSPNGVRLYDKRLISTFGGVRSIVDTVDPKVVFDLAKANGTHAIEQGAMSHPVVLAAQKLGPSSSAAAPTLYKPAGMVAPKVAAVAAVLAGAFALYVVLSKPKRGT